MTALALSLPWPFDREYMQLALLAGAVVGATAPLVGAFLVERRLSLMGDGIGHVAFAGVAIGFLLDTSPLWTALVVAVAAALSLEWLRSRERATGDLALALIFYAGLAAGIVIIGKSGTGSLQVNSYLFGSLLTLDDSDVATVVGLGVAIVAALALFGRALVAIVLDEESARVAGIPVRACNALLAALTAVTVVAAMRAVGVLLVAALMVLPVASARVLARSFRFTMTLASVVGVLAVVLGLTAARQWDLKPGGAIVLAAAAMFVLSVSGTALARQQMGRT